MSSEKSVVHEIDQSLRIFETRSEALSTLTIASTAVLGGVAIMAVEIGSNVASNANNKFKQISHRAGNILGKFSSLINSDKYSQHEATYMPTENGNGYIVENHSSGDIK